jgi:hypothetical protein
MKKYFVIGMAFVLISVGLLSGCTDQKANNNTTTPGDEQTSVDFQKIWDASDNQIKSELLRNGTDYHAIDAMTFGFRDVEIVDANNWEVTGKFTIDGVTHSYISNVSDYGETYTAITTIS